MKKGNLTKIEKLAKTLTDAKQTLESIRDEERDIYDRRSESWQESEKGEKQDENVSYLDDACSDLETVIDSLNSIEE